MTWSMGGLCCRRNPCIYHHPQAEAEELAAEVETLRAENTRLRSALEGLVDVQIFATGWDNGVTDATGTVNEGAYWHMCAMDGARAALKEPKL